MLREELQEYLDKAYPGAKIEIQHSIFGKVHIRFELGGEKRNGTKVRVKQSTERAFAVFNDAFENEESELWILIYEYQGKNIFNAPNDYLHNQFPKEKFSQFYSKLEFVETASLEKIKIRVIIGRVKVKDIKIKSILNAIANTEMGFEPAMNQTIYFFEPSTDRAFEMYDDRGCYVWSDDAEKIRDIYLKRNDWIVDYHRPEIDEYFKR